MALEGHDDILRLGEIEALRHHGELDLADLHQPREHDEEPPESLLGLARSAHDRAPAATARNQSTMGIRP